MPSTVIFDGHDLGALFAIGGQEVAWASPVTRTLDIPGRDGTLFASRKNGPLRVSFACTAIGGTQAERRSAFATLAEWLAVDGPRRLELPDMGGRYYMAVPVGAAELARYLDGDSAAVEFECVSPAAYGTARTATVPSGGSASITVGGNYPTALQVTAASAKPVSSTLLWTLADSTTGEFMAVPFASATARRVAVDCEARTLTVAGAASMLTTDSDWLVLYPGTHTLTMTGTGAASVSWTERWL